MKKDLFAPYVLGGMRLRNRICRSATNEYASHTDGTASDTQLEIYRELAQHDVGLIITGHACVRADGRSDLGQNAMYDDRFIPRQQELTAVVHAAGGMIVQQLGHSGGKSPPAVIGGVPLAPSALEYVPGVQARTLTLQEIAHIQADFAAAAARAQRAGYDGVQIHAAHGYLLSQFIDPALNHRTDAYGGSADNRFRMLRETIEQVRAAVASDFPILLKLHVSSTRPEDGFEAALLRLAHFAAELGVAAAELSGFDFAQQPPEKRRYYLPQAKSLAQQTALPLILVGGLRERVDFEAALDAGMVLASASRPFICQPNFVHILKNGGAAACRGCNGCFRSYVEEGKRCVLHRDPV